MIVRPSVLGRDIERLLAAARVLLAGAALIAPDLDSTGAVVPSLCMVTLVYLLIGVVYGLTQSGVGRPALAAGMHGLDLAFATIMIRSPSGAGFFLILVTFCLLSSIIQWRWRMALFSGAYLLAVYLVCLSLGLVSSERITIRIAFLILTPLGFALASRSADATRDRLLKLARWSSGRYSDSGDAVLRVFRHAADVLGAHEIVVFHHEIDQPTAFKTVYSAASDTIEQSPCEVWADETTTASLRTLPFIVIDSVRALCLTYAGLRRVREPIAAAAACSGPGFVASAPFSGDFCSGRLFACGLRSWRWDQIILVEIVAAHVRSRLEGRTLRDRTARVTAEIERMRLARDLHDGILQTLTAARLQLNALSKEDAAAQPRLDLVSSILQDEQMRLREFIEASRAAPGDVIPVQQIAERIRTVADHWRLRAEIEIDQADGCVTDALYREVYFIIGEAIANAARHGRASAVRAHVACGPRRFILTIEELDGAANAKSDLNILPRSLDERIRELGGVLELARSPNGVSLKVELPTDA